MSDVAYKNGFKFGAWWATVLIASTWAAWLIPTGWAYLVWVGAAFVWVASIASAVRIFRAAAPRPSEPADDDLPDCLPRA